MISYRANSFTYAYWGFPPMGWSGAGL